MDRKKLAVVYQDEWLIAVVKPAGLIVHASEDAPLRDTALRRVRSQTGRRVYPCHRLDRPTSGLLLFAFSGQLARPVFEAFERREVSKSYWALCRGHLQPGQEQLERPIDGRRALTHFRSLREYVVPMGVGKYPTARYSLVEARPISGRRHQIRRHLSHLAHPVIGDSAHGDLAHNRFFRYVWGMGNLFLASRSLELVHPVTGQSLFLEAPLGWRLQACLEQLEEFRLSTGKL
ncbi:MAG: pseudouridine synthase [Vulcanimicrobiota bacterium]